MIEKKSDKSDILRIGLFAKDGDWFDMKPANCEGYYYIRLKHDQLICSLCLIKIKTVKDLEQQLGVAKCYLLHKRF